MSRAEKKVAGAAVCFFMLGTCFGIEHVSTFRAIFTSFCFFTGMYFYINNQ